MEQKDITIIFQDEEIVVIDKPQGLAVQGGEGITKSVDVILSKQLQQKVFLVHRLDRDTCGLLIVAKTKTAAAKWTHLISSRQIEKKYLAVCFGSLKNRQGVFKDTVMAKGQAKSAQTEYEILGTKDIKIDDTAVTLSKIQLTLVTGRMHQIRQHLAKNGCPIVLDDKYGDFAKNRLAKKMLHTKYLLLCAYSLTLPKTISCKRKSLFARLPKIFLALFLC